MSQLNSVKSTLPNSGALSLLATLLTLPLKADLAVEKYLPELMVFKKDLAAAFPDQDIISFSGGAPGGTGDNMTLVVKDIDLTLALSMEAVLLAHKITFVATYGEQRFYVTSPDYDDWRYLTGEQDEPAQPTFSLLESFGPGMNTNTPESVPASISPGEKLLSQLLMCNTVSLSGFTLINVSIAERDLIQGYLALEDEKRYEWAQSGEHNDNVVLDVVHPYTRVRCQLTIDNLLKAKRSPEGFLVKYHSEGAMRDVLLQCFVTASCEAGAALPSPKVFEPRDEGEMALSQGHQVDPAQKDIAALRRALTITGIASPSDEELGRRYFSCVRQLLRSSLFKPQKKWTV